MRNLPAHRIIPEPFLTLRPLRLALTLVVLACPVAAGAADGAEPAHKVSRESSIQRYRELRRLHAQERAHGPYQKGANCVTETLVCWTGKVRPIGSACSCRTRTYGEAKGVIGG